MDWVGSKVEDGGTWTVSTDIFKVTCYLVCYSSCGSKAQN